MKIIFTFSLVFIADVFETPLFSQCQNYLTTVTSVATTVKVPVVQFKFHSNLVIGTAIGIEKSHQLSIDGGLVTTTLGSKTRYEQIPVAKFLTFTPGVFLSAMFVSERVDHFG